LQGGEYQEGEEGNISGANFLDGRVTLLAGDCLEILAALPESSVDSVVTDPPYGLQFMGREWDKLWRNGTEADTAYVERTKGELTSRARNLPDYSASKPEQMQEFHEAWARGALRVLRPGGHLVAFSSTRTCHRMVCAIEDAGFEIRDQLAWTFGSGFPKSRNIGNGWGTALKPAWEPICLARKPLIGTVAANVLEHGVGALNIDGCRVETDENLNGGTYCGADAKETAEGWRMANAKREFVQPLGRWPANLIHDGSEEVVGAFPETGASSASMRGVHGRHDPGQGIEHSRIKDYSDTLRGHEDNGGSAARFFYTAKADAEDRLGSKHPTVKPLDLMQWLVRLVTPKGGTVLDPFAGTGTTGEAAWREGMRAILIEREPEYQADIARRMDLAVMPTKRAAVAKTKNQLDNPGDLPLFAEIAE
jgi:site-specific DNA-methyltransferase (adenine-specific)